MNSLWHAILNPWIWWADQPAAGWTYGLETYWPIVVQGMLVSLALGLVGCFLVVRGTSLLGDALSHSVLPGIVVGFLIGGTLHSPWILVGATVVGLLAAVLVQTVHSQSRVKEDASLGIVFTTLFALGVVMINLYTGQADLDPQCVLYGNIEHFVVDRGGIAPMAIILALVVSGIALFYRQLLVSTFDPGLAISIGIPAGVVHYALMGALSLTVVASFESVGAILAVALLIMPGATARLWTDRMPPMLIVAAVHGCISTLLGYWLSHKAVLHTSASGAITIAGFSIFVLSWLVNPRSGLIVQYLVRRRLQRKIALENLIKTIEELSETVTIDLVRSEMGIDPRVFDRALWEAIAADWIRSADERLELTDAGHARSRQLTRAHILWERFLEREAGLPPDHVHDAAEWIEHHLGEREVERLDAMLSKQAQNS